MNFLSRSSALFLCQNNWHCPTRLVHFLSQTCRAEVAKVMHPLTYLTGKRNLIKMKQNSCLLHTIYTSPSRITTGPAGDGSRQPKLTTSHTSVWGVPEVITHSAPLSTVVDLQTTRCIGAAGESIPHQPQVTRKLSCGCMFSICVHVCAQIERQHITWKLKYDFKVCDSPSL